MIMFSLGRCSLLDFSFVVGDVSRPSLFDMLSFEAFPDQLQVSACRFVGLGWSEASQVSLLILLVAVADPDL